MAQRITTENMKILITEYLTENRGQLFTKSKLAESMKKSLTQTFKDAYNALIAEKLTNNLSHRVCIGRYGKYYDMIGAK